jgi:hypothetical protein
LLTKSSLV